MCGIAGIVGAAGPDLAPIRAMTAALRHRGPDDEGYLLADTRAGRACPFAGDDTVPALSLPPLPAAADARFDLALGHRRLAIIDLSPGGHGPMGSADGQLWITYNGEIFNYLELREELRARGHVFRTASDTEVLLAAWAEWGEEAQQHFNGMWAFALYDARRGVLFCSRDRFGVKPFHYAWDGQLLAFASEIKGLVAHPRVGRRPDGATLVSFLTGAVDEGDRTFVEGVRRLPAGHSLRLDLRARTLAVQRWYALPDPDPRPETAGEVRELLTDAVRLRLRSDVDVGTCLSGGLDSSSLVALTARLRDGSGRGRLSFSIVYPEDGLDESAFVGEVVAATGVDGRRSTPTAKDLLRDLPNLVRDQEEPFPGLGVYSQWRVMRLAHEAGIKVLLDGQGADEVFGGYHYQLGPWLAEMAHTEGPGSVLRHARAAAAATGRPLWFLLGLFAYHALPMPGALRRAAQARHATHGRVPAALLDPERARSASVPTARHVPRASLKAERRAALQETSLPALLRFEDRNSMAFGIEARTPYLDYRLVERALALPARELVREGWTKAPLREAVRGLVPEAVRLRRDKLGFPTPEVRWLEEITPSLREWLGPGARVRPWLHAPALDAWLSEPASLARRPGLWRLVSAELWLRWWETQGLTRP